MFYNLCLVMIKLLTKMLLFGVRTHTLPRPASARIPARSLSLSLRPASVSLSLSLGRPCGGATNPRPASSSGPRPRPTASSRPHRLPRTWPRRMQRRRHWIQRQVGLLLMDLLCRVSAGSPLLFPQLWRAYKGKEVWGGR